jgi:hypothetical protein
MSLKDVTVTCLSAFRLRVIPFYVSGILSKIKDGTMKRKTIALIVLGLGIAIALLRSVRSTSAQQTVYNPYPPGLLPANLDSEIARVLQEIAVIEARAIQGWRSLPPPTTPPVRSGPNPPVLPGSGTESIETLRELMLFDVNMSPGRNQALHVLPHAICGLDGPIPSVNLTIIAYPGTVHYRPASGRHGVTRMHRCSLYCNKTRNRCYSLAGISGIRAPPNIGYEIPTPNSQRAPC